MFFLEQIKNQFFSQLVSYQDANLDGFSGGNEEDTSNQIETTQDLNLSQEDQELISKIEEKLAELDAVITIEGTQQLNAYINGLKSILADNPNEAEDEPEEMARLRGNIERLTQSLEAAQLESGQLKQILTQTIQSDAVEIQSDINEMQGEAIDDAIDKAYEEGIEEKERQEELERLETERDSYKGIFNEQLSEFTLEQKEGFDAETKTAIENIEGLLNQDIAEDTTIAEKITLIENLNKQLTEGIESFSVYLEFEKEVITNSNYVNRFHEIESGLEDGKEIPQDIKNSIDALMSKPRLGSIVDMTEQLRRNNEEFSTIMLTINTELIQREGIHSRKLTDEEQAQLSELRAEYILVRSSIQEKLGPYMVSEVVVDPFNELINSFTSLNVTFDRSTDSQEFDELNSNRLIPVLKELNIRIEIAIRDEQIVGNEGKSLGEIRSSLVEQKFNELKENGTQIQKDIIGDVDFENLTSDMFGALAENGANLSEFLLVDMEGKTFTGDFEDGQEFIMNSGGNTEIEGYLSGYIFDIQSVEKITVGGIEYTRDTDGEPSVGFKDNEGNPIGRIKDGQKIIVSKVESISDEDYIPTAERLRASFVDDRTASILTEAYGRYETMEKPEGFSWEAMWKAIISGDLLTFAEQLEHIMEGRFHVDEETGEMSIEDPHLDESYTVTEADMSLASLSSFSADHRKNLVRSARTAGISPDELVGHMNSECEKYGFPPQRFIVLIGKESGWNNAASAHPISSARGFSQMLDGTWEGFGVGNRSNPKDQLSASLKYLNHIMSTRGASPEDACALYNTGPYFKINNSPASAAVVNGNPAIVRRIPNSIQSNGITQREYFLGAVSYYNDVSYEQARQSSTYARR